MASTAIVGGEPHPPGPIYVLDRAQGRAGCAVASCHPAEPAAECVSANRHRGRGAGKAQEAEFLDLRVDLASGESGPGRGGPHLGIDGQFEEAGRVKDQGVVADRTVSAVARRLRQDREA